MPGPLSEAQFKLNIKAHPENKSEYELGIQYTHTHACACAHGNIDHFINVILEQW